MYCTQAEFAARFGQRELDQLLNTANLAAGETGRTYAASAADGDAILDSYLAMRGVAVPVTVSPVPPRILELAADLTRYELYDDVKDDDTPAAVVVRRKLALDFLKAFAKGEVAIPGLPDAAPAGGGSVFVSSKPRVFTDDTLAGY